MNSGSASSRYALSFTTGGLLEREAAILAAVYSEHRNWDEVRDIAVERNLLQARTHTTGVRRVRETVKRLAVLSGPEVEVLPELTASERAHLMWAAACRRYDLIGEFAEEVVRERFLTLTGTVSHEDYDSFYRAKAVWHDELNQITTLSYKKLREVVFKMMVEAGLLSTTGVIEPALFSTRVACLFAQSAPGDVRFFPTKEA